MNRWAKNQIPRTAGADLNSYFCGSYAEALQAEAPNGNDRYPSKTKTAEESSTACTKLNFKTGASYAEALQCEYLKEEDRNGTVARTAQQLPTAERCLKYPNCRGCDDTLRAETLRGEIQKPPIAMQAHESSTANPNPNSMGSGEYAEILQSGINFYTGANYAKELQCEYLKEEGRNGTVTKTAQKLTTDESGLKYPLQAVTLRGEIQKPPIAMQAHESSTANANSNFVGSRGYSEILQGGSRNDIKKRPQTSNKTSEETNMTVRNKRSFIYRNNSESLQERRQYCALTSDNMPETYSLGGAGVPSITQNLHTQESSITSVDRDDTEELAKLQRKQYVLRALAHVGNTLRPDPLKALECEVGKNIALSSCFSSHDLGATDIAASNGTGTETKKLRRIEFALSVLNNPNKCETDHLIQQCVTEALQRRKQAMFSSLLSGCGTAVTEGSDSVQPPVFNLRVASTCGGRRRGVDYIISSNDVPSVPSIFDNPHLLSSRRIDPRLLAMRGENQRECDKDPRQEPKLMTEKMNFPQKLMNILSRKETQHAITWLPEGDAFSIIDGRAFVSEVAPIFFKRDKKIDSFLRRLSRWGFEKVSYVHSTRAPLTEMVFWHKHFLRAEPELCAQIKTKYGSRGKGVS